MAAHKIKIREIKKRIKITEVQKEPEQGIEQDENLEEIVDIPEISPVATLPENPSSPTLAQHLDDIPAQSSAPQDNRPIARQGLAPTRAERNASTAVNYAVSQQTSSRRSYDSSIRSAEIAAASTASASRINPTLTESPQQQAMNQANRNALDMRNRDIGRESVEPALRQFKEEKDYRTERAESYVAKRRTDML